MPSFTTWRTPIRNEHPRIYCNKARSSPIGAVASGPFADGETVTASGGAVAAVRGATADGAAALVYVLASGAIGSGETVTGSQSGASASTSGAASDYPLSLETVRARAAGSHSSYFSSLRSAADARLERPLDYWDGLDAEHPAMLALLYAVDPALTQYAARARDVALYLVGLPPGSTSRERERLKALAYIYDWAFGFLSPAERATLRSSIASRVDARRGENAAEYLWGTAHGNNVAASYLPAILGDGSSAENTTWSGWMEELLDAQDRGGNDSYLPGYRYSGDADGGSYKGAGPTSYTTDQTEFHVRLFPLLASALGVDWNTTEEWWNLLGHWLLWTWRPDGSFFRNVEQQGILQYSTNTSIYCLEVAARENNAYGEHLAWLEEELAAGGAGMWGGLHAFNLLFRDPARAAIRPTISRTGGEQLRTFRAVGFHVFRTGWSSSTDVAATLETSPYFTGGHAKRRAGCLTLAAYGKNIFFDKGSYDPGQTKSYKLSGDASETGHRHSYAQRIASGARMWRIFDEDEPAENELDSFRRQNSAVSRFGTRTGSAAVSIHNDGGQLWPHLTTPERYQPHDIGEVITHAAFRRDGAYPVEPSETAEYCYVLHDLTAAYYSGKASALLQHVLWIKSGAIPGWDEPILLLVEDFSTHEDATAGNETKTLILNSEFEPTGSAADLTFAVGDVRVYYRTLSPSVEVSHTSAPYTVDGIEYTATNAKPFDDPAGQRTEIHPASSSARHKFVTVIMPSPTATTPPATVLIDSGGLLGATIGGIACTVADSAPYAASVGASTDTTPPAAPTGTTASSAAGFVSLDWDDNSEGDLHNYDIFRADPT